MTKRVILLVTGKCELKGLHRALRRAFADAVDVEFETRDLFNSFTSEKIDVNALAARPAGDERGPVEKLAMALIDAGLERRCDLALAVDDLELVNRGRDQEVRAFFRDAVEREIQRLELTNSARERVAQRCSFHLLVPMVECTVPVKSRQSPSREIGCDGTTRTLG